MTTKLAQLDTMLEEMQELEGVRPTAQQARVGNLKRQLAQALHSLGHDQRTELNTDLLIRLNHDPDVAWVFEETDKEQP